MLRRWEVGDCRPIYDIVSDSAVRAVSLNPEPIPYEQHEAWFTRALSDPEREYYVLEVDGRVAGYVRLDGERISIALVPWARGRGWAVDAIREAIRKSGRRRVVAEIHPENTASLRTFERAGFRPEGSVASGGREFLVYAYRRRKPPTHM